MDLDKKRYLAEIILIVVASIVLEVASNMSANSQNVFSLDAWIPLFLGIGNIVTWYYVFRKDEQYFTHFFGMKMIRITAFASYFRNWAEHEVFDRVSFGIWLGLALSYILFLAFAQ